MLYLNNTSGPTRCMRTRSGDRLSRDILLFIGRHSLTDWYEEGAVQSHV